MTIARGNKKGKARCMEINEPDNEAGIIETNNSKITNLLLFFFT